MLVRCDILDERKQCILRELARVHHSKALVILQMSISRQRCLRNNLSWVINILTNCSNAKSNQQLLKVYDYLPICLYVLVLNVYDGIHSNSGTCTWQFLLYIVLCFIIINSTEISRLTSYPQTSSSHNQEFIAISILFFFSWWYQWWWNDTMCCDWQSNPRENVKSCD